MPPSSTVEGDGQRKSEVLEDKRDSPEGADTVASELQRLSLVKKAGEKMLQQLSMKNSLNLSPLIALIQNKPWGAFCQTNQLETSGIFNRKWSNIFQVKQSFPSTQAIHLHFVRNFDYC